MAAQLGYEIFDADNHLYEQVDAFTRHLPQKYRHEFFWMTDERGRRHIILHGRYWPYIPNPTYDPIGLPGSLEDMYRGKLTGHQASQQRAALEPLANRPEYLQPEARLARLDQQGVGACFLFPTMMSGIEYQCRDDIDLTYALVDAYQRWLLDEWTFNTADRLLTAVPITLADPVRAVKQLEFALEHDARLLMVLPAPVFTAYGPRSPGDPMFDPFWARVAEAGVVVGCHAGDTGYQRYSGDWTGRYEMSVYQTSVPMSDWIYVEGRAPADFITSLIVHGACARHRGLKVASIESGGHWVPSMMTLMRKWHRHYPESFPGDPIAAFEESIWISPFWEDDIEELRRYVPIEHIIAGSDWPHPEGLAEPCDYVKGLDAFNAVEKRLILRDNGYALSGLRSDGAT